MNKKFLLGILPLLLGVLACQPVIAIGRNEFLLVLLLFAVLLGPPLYKMARRLEEFFQRRKKDR